MAEKDLTPASYDMVLGEMRGQLREVVHTLNNLSGKFDQLTREVIALGPLAADILQLKADVERLKAVDNQHIGGWQVVATVIKSPVIGWIVLAVAGLWATLTGRFNP